ncbi:chromate resistance protein ChrB domain-containing protein [Streptomyces canus]|uniref:chromate resistance protein ChrB domain-containing protein n=1 Tax=Streptomyces canus TaxID=58343 RepID=UPI0009A10BBB
MRRVTLSHVHLDRVASPWLVRRFVDPTAEFECVEWGQDGRLPDPARLPVCPKARDRSVYRASRPGCG